MDIVIITKLRELHSDGHAIFIQGNTPSLKNSKEIVNFNTKLSSCCGAPYFKLGNKKVCSKCNQACGLRQRYSLVPSKTVKKYVEATHGRWVVAKDKFLELVKDQGKPYYVGLYYIRDSKRRFDFDNAGQIITDLMTQNHWIEDDDAGNIITYPLGYHVDKANAGVVILPFRNFSTSIFFNNDYFER